jgi:hypothetical protein
MRLSEWRLVAPSREALGAKVVSVLEPVLVSLGTEPDPHCWIFWGDDPTARYFLAAAVPAGLVTGHVRVNVPGEGPRVSGKLNRWPRVQLGEFALETSGERLILSAQLEGQVLRAVDDDAKRAAVFMQAVVAGIDGRSLPDIGALEKRAKIRPRRVSSRSRSTAAGARSRTRTTAGSRGAPGSRPTSASDPSTRSR